MKSEYLERLRGEIELRYGCKAVHAASCPVNEEIKDRVRWNGNIEVFLLIGSLKANRCFAWSHENGTQTADGDPVTVLEIPPVTSPQAAIRMMVAS